MKKEVTNNQILKTIDSLTKRMDTRFDRMDIRFDRIDDRFEKLEQDLQELSHVTKAGFDDLSKKVEQNTQRIVRAGLMMSQGI